MEKGLKSIGCFSPYPIPVRMYESTPLHAARYLPEGRADRGGRIRLLELVLRAMVGNHPIQLLLYLPVGDLRFGQGRYRLHQPLAGVLKLPDDGFLVLSKFRLYGLRIKPVDII